MSKRIFNLCLNHLRRGFDREINLSLLSIAMRDDRASWRQQACGDVIKCYFNKMKKYPAFVFLPTKIPEPIQQLRLKNVVQIRTVIHRHDRYYAT